MSQRDQIRLIFCTISSRNCADTPGLDFSASSKAFLMEAYAVLAAGDLAPDWRLSSSGSITSLNLSGAAAGFGGGTNAGPFCYREDDSDYSDVYPP